MNTNWEKVFYHNISKYIQIITNLLSESYSPEPLKNHIKIQGGYAFKSSEYTHSGIPVIRISDFQNEKIVIDQVKRYKKDDSLSRYLLKEGDIIIAMTGGTIGKLAVVQKGLGKLYLNQRVGKFEVLNPDEFIGEYVYWIARGVEEKIKSLAWGGAQPNVSNKQIENMAFAFPDKQVQVSIVGFLNDLRDNTLKDTVYFDKVAESLILNLQFKQLKNFSIIDELTHQQALLKQLRQAVLQEAVQGKLTEQWRKENPDVEPASVLLEKSKAEKERLVKEKKIKKQKPLPPIKTDEIPFELPEGWVFDRGIVAADYIDPQPSHRTPPVHSDGVPYVAMKDITAGGIIDFRNSRKVSKKILIEHKKRYKLSEGDFIFGKIGTIGKPVKLPSPFEYTLSANLILIQPNTNLFIPEFLFLYLSSPIITNYLTEQRSTMSYPVFGMKKARLMPIPFLPKTEQQAIVEKVEALLAKVSRLEEEVQQNQQHAEQLLQSVLREVMEPERERIS